MKQATQNQGQRLRMERAWAVLMLYKNLEVWTERSSWLVQRISFVASWFLSLQGTLNIQRIFCNTVTFEHGDVQNPIGWIGESFYLVPPFCGIDTVKEETARL